MLHVSSFRLSLLVCLLTVATAAYALKAYAPADPNAISGSGVVTAEARDVHSFSRVALRTLGDVTINVGEELSVLVSAEDNLVRLLTTDVRDGWLVIEGPDNLTLQPTRPILYMITMPALDGVELSGGGMLRARHLHEPEITVSMSSIGTVSLSGQVHQQILNVAGTGRYYGFDLICDHAAVTISSVGSAELTVHEELNATITGSGNVIYAGDPAITSHITGEGEVVRN